jgi:hypothetical protein
MRDSLPPSSFARLARAGATAALSVLGAACGGGSPRQTLEQVASAAATARLAADELRARHTSARYTASTLDVLHEAVEQEAGSLRPGELPPAVRDRALAAVALARDALGAMADAAHRRDTVALLAGAQQADSARHTLDAVDAALPER